MVALNVYLGSITFNYVYFRLSGLKQSFQCSSCGAVEKPKIALASFISY